MATTKSSTDNHVDHAENESVATVHVDNSTKHADQNQAAILIKGEQASESFNMNEHHQTNDQYSSQQSQENDRSSLSPSKVADPTRKKTFKIISVKKGASTSASGDLAIDNDTDSIDGLDESQTEDVSSEFYDSSKATDLEMDGQENMIPLTPDEMTATTIVINRKPDRDLQSRFKVVKIETKEPFRRGKWICHDFFDTAPVSVGENGTKVTADSIIHSAISGNVSSSSSIEYVHGIAVNDSSSNIFVAPVVPLTSSVKDGHQIMTDVFFPIQPAPSSPIMFNQVGVASEESTSLPFQTSVPESNIQTTNQTSQGQTTTVASLSKTPVYPYAQNYPPSMDLTDTPVPGTQLSENVNIGNTDNNGFLRVNGMPVPRSQSQGQLSGVLAPVQIQNIHNTAVDSNQPLSNTATAIPSTVAPTSGVTQAPVLSAMSKENTMTGIDGLGLPTGELPMNESASNISTIHGDELPPSGLEEAVGNMYIDLANEEDPDESGPSTVAIDNKIEQAMDLVKRHLMYAVREEVEILKQQIGELMERITHLEYENTLLRSEALPETLQKLPPPRGPMQTSPGMVPFPQQATGQTPSVVQPLQSVPNQPTPVAPQQASATQAAPVVAPVVKQQQQQQQATPQPAAQQQQTQSMTTQTVSSTTS